MKLTRILDDRERQDAEHSLYADDGVFVVVWGGCAPRDGVGFWDTALRPVALHRAATRGEATSIADDAIEDQEFVGSAVFVMIREDGGRRERIIVRRAPRY